ncbi:unnamed protein product [Rotaria sp. Silwood1]|nr:unnamed protein product [Rotaria sp. Silwood1]CAF1321175.1 unnamed protein product [Rotaria sp. Silwood1]CAF1630789.1 unnamed protein product [Rotaria sp. Silwood1]CAF1630814.1 unnamed protein product [Rotaria sp. Silwood1]
MLFKQILFPAPYPPQYSLTSHKNKLFWLPATQEKLAGSQIPCMLYSPIGEANFFVIWCHGNGDDIGSIDMAMNTLSQRIQAHVMAFEYPSYGLCKRSIEPTEETINNHAERAYSFVRDTLRWPSDRILIYGHSIGSGPACHLAATKAVGGLILKSPYKSLSHLIQEKIWIFSKLFSIPNWNNLEAIKHIRCPILFIHGQRDNLIPFHHSKALYNSLNHNEKKRLVLLPDDDHNSIPDSIFLMHVEIFLREYFSSTTESMPQVKISSALFHLPLMI